MDSTLQTHADLEESTLALAAHPSRRTPEQAPGDAPQSPPLWSFITVTYNSAPTLVAHWKDTRLPADVEWIVVDNASRDNSVEVAQELGARVITLDSNIGFSGANNRGFIEAKGELIAFVNPDVIVDMSTLAVLERRASNGELCAPQLTNPDGTLQPNGRGAPIMLNKIRNRLPERFRNNAEYLLFAEPGTVRPVSWLTGAAVIARRDVFAALGPWDERYFLYAEDIDLSLRAAEAGYPVVVDGNANWVHSWARDVSGLNLRAWYREFSSLARLYRRFPRFLFGTGGR